MFLSAAATRAKLGISPQSLTKLTECNVVSAVQLGGSQSLYDEGNVSHLSLEPLRPRLEAFAVRFAAPRELEEPDELGRKFIGWDDAWDAKTKQLAACAWWQVGAPQEQVNRPLVAVVSDWIVGVWHIERWNRIDDGDAEQYATLTEATDEEKAQYPLYGLLRLGGGPKQRPLDRKFLAALRTEQVRL